MNLSLRCDGNFRSPVPSLTLVVLFVAGCSPVNTSTPEQKPSTEQSADAFDEMMSAAAHNRWEVAWEHADDVLIAYPNDSEKLAFVAEVAFRSGHRDRAADLLVDSAGASDWTSEDQIQRAFTALLAAGRLLDGIDLLRTATLHSPENTALRRLLADLLIATEQHHEAGEHRRSLIRSRDFDLNLLHAASSYDQRTEEVTSLQQMLELNPSDLRPQIGEAKQRFDSGLIQEAVSLLEPIVKQHPEYLPAQVLLGRALVQLGQYERLDQWSKSAASASAANSDFWLTIGDWATERGSTTTAIQCYGQAAKRAPDRVAAWQKLAALAVSEPILAEDAAAIQKRADLLLQRRQNFAEASIRGLQNPDSSRALAQSAMQLGWLWEAEAWAATGLTMTPLSPEQKLQLNSLRQSIIQRLNQGTPWDTGIQSVSWGWLSTISADAAIAKLRDTTDAGIATGPSDASSDSAASRQTSIAANKTPMFAEEAKQRGLMFFGRTADDLSEPGVLTSQMLGCGGGTIDYDLDGWPDVYFASAGGTPPLDDSAPNAMFRNLAGTFDNTSLHCDARDQGFGTGVCVGDANEDGFDDLLVLNYGPNRIWINNGDGTFSDRSSQLLPPDSVWSTSAAMADLNADGLGDIVIANYCAGLEPTTLECQLANSAGVRSCSPNQFSAEPDNFYAATQQGVFMDANDDWAATPSIPGRGLGVVAGSFDKTTGIDVLVANDMTTNHYWTADDLNPLSAGSFQLAELGTLLGLATDAQSRSQGSMGIAVSDFNGDQLADFYVSNYADEYSTLSISSAGGGWRDRTANEKLVAPTIPLVGFGTQAIDFDQNGTDELIVTNGHVDDYRIVRPASTYAQPIQLFQRTTAGTLQEIGEHVACDYFQEPHIGRALWTIDANRDGRVDVLITHQSEPTALLVNQTETSSSGIAFRLVGRQSSRGAVGSVVSIDHEGAKQTKFVTSGSGYFCSNERCTRFGLGDNRSNVRVEVQWPNGKVQTWPSLRVDREWLLVEDEDAFELPKISE
ncbi:FG-GAP-like repeat-containing protein [Rhodopirellula sp. P2]|uniref:FG-GAP-like repeat-containing protein n=1 Tax=Rhodopirellula sp. P2 TaxID=2127060 RepID=UPI002367EA24|nr:FG-GAP-like repeat-containing protein [Rhodopirellula sp. P2]WDQ17978.1 FG-GAP-like repeat-containing protein [Rhodopirellula sp. P2]